MDHMSLKASPSEKLAIQMQLNLFHDKFLGKEVRSYHERVYLH